MPNKTIVCAALLAGFGCAGSASAESGPSSQPAVEASAAPKGAVAGVPTALSDATYDRIKALVELRPGELQFQAVPWLSTAYEGIRASQREDKPLLLWLYFGGPRGAC